MSDDRNWNSKFDGHKKEFKKRSIDDKRLIKKHASMIIFGEVEGVEVWTITFNTKFGQNDCVYYPESKAWKKKIGKAHGVGASSMIKYFNPRKE